MEQLAKGRSPQKGEGSTGKQGPQRPTWLIPDGEVFCEGEQSGP